MGKCAAIAAVFLLACTADADPSSSSQPGYSGLSNQSWSKAHFDDKPEDKRRRAEELYRELMESPSAKPEEPKAASASDESVAK